MPVQESLFVSQRNFTLRSTLGHSVTFARGKATYVPKALHALAVERGILPCDADGKPIPEKGEEIVEEVEAQSKVVLAPSTREARDEAIEAACRSMVKTNNAKDFTAGGTPNAEAVSFSVGWKVDQKEVRAVWTRIRPELLGNDN